MVNTKLIVSLFGVFLMVLSACTQVQQGDIAGQAVSTLTPATNKDRGDCVNFAFADAECPELTQARASAIGGRSPTRVNLVVTAGAPVAMDTDNDGNVFTDSDGNGIDDDAMVDSGTGAITFKDELPRPVVTVYPGSQSPTPSDPTNTLAVSIQPPTTTLGAKEVLLLNKIGWVFNRGANGGAGAWEAVEFDWSGRTAADIFSATMAGMTPSTAGQEWMKLATGSGITAPNAVTPGTVVTKAVRAGKTPFAFTVVQGGARFNMADDYFGRVPLGKAYYLNADYTLVAVMSCTCDADTQSTRPCNRQRSWDCQSNPNTGDGKPSGPTGNARFTVVPIQLAEGYLGEAGGDAPVAAPE